MVEVSGGGPGGRGPDGACGGAYVSIWDMDG